MRSPLLCLPVAIFTIIVGFLRIFCVNAKIFGFLEYFFKNLLTKRMMASIMVASLGKTQENN